VSTDHVEIVRGAFAAAMRGDFAALRELLADDVRWHAAGDDGGGCQNRREALVWMERAVTRGIRAEVLDVRAVDEHRVLTLLHRHPGDGEHGQIVHFREGKVSEIVVYPSAEAAIEDAGGS
jgi:ketosteroid isomerase-like protein